MLYLEDYLEMIEHLPQELRDRFTEMRSLDLAVQNNMDLLEKQVKQIFGACRRGELNGDRADVEFAEIRKGYVKSLEDADEKVQLANQMYELVERYLRKLDTELHKFKCELEADNKGITEVLEKRSLELDTPTTLTATPQTPNTPSGYHKDSRYRVRAEKRRESWSGSANIANSGTTGNRSSESSSNNLNNLGSRSGEARSLVATTPPLSFSRTDSAIQAALGRSVDSGSPGGYSLGHMGAGNAIAAAASQAIAATQQMQQGRRSASLKASYEAINAANVGTSGLSSGELQLGRELAGAAQQALQAVQQHETLGFGSTSGSYSHSSSKRHKKKSSSYSNNTSSGGNRVMLHSQQSSASRSSSPSQSVGSVGVSNSAPITSMPLEDGLTDGEWAYDPNEPRYCVCNQVSYGEMVACDNHECPYEWFHYPCVGVTAPPKGKWFCPPCTANMRRRGNRKN